MPRSRPRTADTLAMRVLAASPQTAALWAVAINAICLAGASMTGQVVGWSALSVMTAVALAWCFGAMAAFAIEIVLLTAIQLAAARHADSANIIDHVADSVALVLAVAVVAIVVAHVRDVLSDERHAARHDPLTGLLNRRAFFRQLELSARPDVPARLLAYIDLDGFKAINDAHGHDAGDDVLRACATSLRALAPGAALARLGGDEFAALIVTEPGDDPYEISDRLHDRFREALDKLDYPGLGCSMGALFVRAGAGARHEQLVVWADTLMYQVKAAGKGHLRVGHAELMAA